MTTPDKRQAILQALERILRDHRFDEVKMDDIARSAGVGKGTVYRYFEDKEDLFLQMVQAFLQEEVDEVSVAAASSLPPREKLIRVGETIGRHIQLHGTYIRMLHGRQIFRRKRGTHEIMRNHHERLGRILSRILEDAEQAGLLRPGLDADAVLCIYKGAIMSSSMRLLHSGHAVPMADIMDLILSGIGRDP